MILIGNPANRRVTMFLAAMAAQGHPPPRVLAWSELLEHGVPELHGLVRIDSTGEDDEVERALLRRGEHAARAEGSPAIAAPQLERIPRELGRILYPRQHHLGFLEVVREIEERGAGA
ncbi:MAG TPA: hypothetical protein VGC41_23620, partial [Kofleriaceae bacterium]